jgi:hypothetical protein
MRRKQRPVLLRAPALVVLLALLLATAGLVYAHWTATLEVNGQVNTGGVGVAWFDAWTNDDGVNNTDGERIEGIYDAWGEQSSKDPSASTIDPTGGSRYDKDVAACWAQTDGGSNLQLWIEGAYPSYYCALTALLGGQGSVPVRATSINLVASKDFDGFCDDSEDPYFGPVNWDEGGPFADVGEDGVFDEGTDYRLHDCGIHVDLDVRPGDPEGTFAFGMEGGPDEIVGDISAGVRCGTQIDPVPCHWEFGDGEWYDGGTYGDGEGHEYAGEGPRQDEEVFQICEGPMTETSGWLHVEQEASQWANYQFNLSQEFVNWNEWDVDMCTVGAVVDLYGDGSEFCVWNGSTCEPY